MNFARDILPLKNAIFRTALRIVLSRDEAEDIVQDTMLKLWERREQIAEVQNLEAFAVTMARNLARDRVALHSSQNVSFDEALHDRADEWQQNADEQMIQNEEVRRIEKLINALPEVQRTILHLRDVEGHTYKEIAQIMDMSETNVKVTLFRARGVLREALEKQNYYG